MYGSASTDHSRPAPPTPPPKKKLAVAFASIVSPSTYEAFAAATLTWNSGLRNSATRKLFPVTAHCWPRVYRMLTV